MWLDSAVSESQSAGQSMSDLQKELMASKSEVERLERLLRKAETDTQLAEKERDRGLDAQKVIRSLSIASFLITKRYGAVTWNASCRI
eukprot:SAG31_NODE_296_length_18227_cov_39.663173_14_plen_88_part_00